VNVLLSEIVPVDPFGHMAVVDAGSRGITLFDLATMSVAVTPYL
jgi:hypothetical protein